MEKKDILESNFAELEKIVEQMESGDLSLDESFELYKKGIKLVQSCNDSINKVEKEMQIISEGTGPGENNE